jgi:hypothetical protein
MVVGRGTPAGPGQAAPRRRTRATRPSSAMSCATVFTDTRQPAGPQLLGHPGRAVCAAGLGEDLPDPVGQLLPPLLSGGGRPVAPLVEPRLGQPERSAGHRVRHPMLGRLAGDERRHAHFIASLTQDHGALEDITLHGQFSEHQRQQRAGHEQHAQYTGHHQQPPSQDRSANRGRMN